MSVLNVTHKKEGKNMAIDDNKMYKKGKTGRVIRGKFLRQMCENARKIGRPDLEAELLLDWQPIEDKNRR